MIDLSKKCWITENGDRYEFKDMSTLHLKNTIQFLKSVYSRKELYNTNTYEELCKELIFRPLLKRDSNDK